MKKLLLVGLLLTGCQTTKLTSFVTADGRVFYETTCDSTLVSDKHWGHCYQAAADQCEQGFITVQRSVSNTHVFQNDRMVILLTRRLTFRCTGT
jgi:hypothetical protein